MMYTGGAYGGSYGAGRTGGIVVSGDNGTCCVAQGEDCTACGVGCGNGGQGALAYVGTGRGDYIQETTYRYVGCGGDFARPRRDFTCLITTCCLLSLLLLIPLLLWLCSVTPTSLPFDCDMGFAQWEEAWSPAQQRFCCATMGRGCTTALPNTTPPPPPPTPFPTSPPTPPPTPLTTQPTTPHGPVDPFNCAVDPENTWAPDKKEWCCRIHHLGCPQPIIPIIPVPQPTAPPADPYNCADGFANWQAGWSVGKKEWCCRVHGKGCNNQGGGCVTSSKPYDCNAGFANWMAGWSVAKKAWCCSNEGKGCPPAAGGCA